MKVIHNEFYKADVCSLTEGMFVLNLLYFQTFKLLFMAKSQVPVQKVYMMKTFHDLFSYLIISTHSLSYLLRYSHKTDIRKKVYVQDYLNLSIWDVVWIIIVRRLNIP